MTTYFTSDTHFGHKLCADKRGYDAVTDMDLDIARIWNAIVGPKDTVWHLGDFSFHSRGRHRELVQELNGSIHLVLGNHDLNMTRMLKMGFASVHEAKYLRIEGHKLYLSHYACRVWRNSHHGSMHLYGHSHGALPGIGRSMDVGWDVFHRPVSLTEVADLLRDQGPVPHHPKEQ